MKNVVKVLTAVAFVSSVGIGRVEAEPSPPPTATPAITPAPKPTRQPKGRCLFPSSRALSAVIAAEAKNMYLKQGYQRAFVAVRVVIKKPAFSALSIQNVTGIKELTPQTGSPANLQISANPGGEPIELGCNTEATVVTSVVLIDAAGKGSNGRTTTKVTVQGAFN